MPSNMITDIGALQRLRQKVWDIHHTDKPLELWERKFVAYFINDNIGDFTINQGAVIDKIHHKIHV